MRSLILALCVLALGFSVTPGHADWLNPTTRGDCQTFRWPIQDQLFQAQREAHRCFSANWGTPGNGPNQRQHVCTIQKFGERRSEIPACSGLEQRVCKLSNEIQRRVQICRPKLNAFLQRQAALEARQKELERLAETNSLGARIDRAGREYVERRYGALPSGAPNLADDARIAGHGMSRLFGVRMAGPSGAYSLSSSMSIVGNQVIARLNQRAIGELDAALQRFNESNARPTASQLEQFYAQRADLVGQYATHMTRVQNTDHRLPLGDKSAVVGAYANSIVQLVQMRNSGEIDEPIAALGAVVASVLAINAYKQAEERTIARSEPDMPPALSADRLREMRQAALAPVQAERARIAAEQRATVVLDDPPAPAPQPTPTLSSALSCLSRLGNLVTNTCDRVVFCFTSEFGWRPVDPASVVIAEGRESGPGGALFLFPESTKQCRF